MPQEPSSTHRVVHLTERPEDAQLLSELARLDALHLDVAHVRDLAGLERQLGQTTHLVVADLPPLWTGAQAALMRVLAAHPEVPIVFRWGEPGNWLVEDPTEQTRRAICESLRPTPERADRSRHAHEVDPQLRLQGLLFAVGRFDFWDFEQCVRATTELVSDLFGVERTSVWELTQAEEITCLDLFTRSTRTHSAGEKLTHFPRYLEALRDSLSIPADDALHDPRTREFRSYLEERGITSMLDAPLRRGSRIVGVLCLEHVGEEHSWTVADQCGAAAIATLLARGIEARDRLVAEENLQRTKRIDALGRIAGQIAHDFHNRLTVLNLLVDQLDAEDENDALSRREITAQLMDELGRARQQVRRLLGLNRRGKVAQQRLELAHTVEAELPLLRRLIGGHELKLIVTGPKLHVLMAPDDLREILTNLITNARDAMTAQRGECSIHVRAATLHAGTAGAGLVIEDSGAGLSAEAQAHLFEPFFSTKERAQGSGLGLASVHHAVAAAGGRVGVRSSPQRGTRVEIVLPLAPAEENG